MNRVRVRLDIIKEDAGLKCMSSHGCVRPLKP
jgi:hypothetical protein